MAKIKSIPFGTKIIVNGEIGKIIGAECGKTVEVAVGFNGEIRWFDGETEVEVYENMHPACIACNAMHPEFCSGNCPRC